jgi:hypothetical protein
VRELRFFAARLLGLQVIAIMVPVLLFAVILFARYYDSELSRNMRIAGKGWRPDPRH